MTRLPSWSAVAETPLSASSQSGVALRLPSQSKTRVRQSGLFWVLLTYVMSGFFSVVLAQSNVVSHASDFTSVEYYPAPNQQQMKSRLSGAEAQPLTGDLLVIKQLKLETFGVNGKLELVVNAPECVYNESTGTASSSGRLEVQTGDGKVRVEGKGFLWRQSGSFLYISNQVRTVIMTGLGKGFNL